MAMYRLCSVCGNRVTYGGKCKCEVNERKEKYKHYKENRTDKREQEFYSSGAWIKCRNSVASNQFGLDIIEWSKGNIVQAEAYHHIIETKDDWSLRLDASNIIGLTKRNHIAIHRMMNKSCEEKIKVQNYLKELLKRYENEIF
ncbi:hypothetical protein [Clostridium sp. YIM B02500]|uniref:hypothetical protein n=1 Tax=Clostridium sp. YIM B02500 TaxID=2910681 RepID=UPI001EEE85DB|nr:hypothetical protein [Clostridium sp. YIM B02500]